LRYDVATGFYLPFSRDLAKAEVADTDQPTSAPAERFQAHQLPKHTAPVEPVWTGWRMYPGFIHAATQPR
jgi:hypothetical protein